MGEPFNHPQPPAPYYGTPAPLLDFVHETMWSVHIIAENAMRYADLGDAAGLEYSTRRLIAYLKAAAPIVKAIREGRTH